MSPTLDALLHSWPRAPWLLAGLLVSAAIYARGWLVLHRRDPDRWPRRRLAAFLSGLLALFAALASPIEPFASWLLQVHMIQHLLLMMLAPPLIWLGAPLLPALAGLPADVRTYWVVPLFRSRRLRRGFRALTHPGFALPLFLASVWLWHVPAFYEGALRRDALHYLQHASFLGSGLVFWYPVVRPFPARPRWSPWLLFPYLIAADLSNTVLSALLTFASRPIYAYYLGVPRVGGLSVLDDQGAAGVIMWVPGSLAFLLPLFAQAVRVLFGEPKRRGHARGRSSARIPIPARTAPPDKDVLRLPLVGRFLRWRYARLALQVPLLLLAGVLIFDGASGPAIGPLNLAGVVPWIHWRGLVLIGLLAAGNVSCMACPFLLPRTLARRWLPAGRRWPRALRGKWLAVALLIVYLWAYEAYSLWDRPAWTAAIIAGYFAAAFVVDGLFRGASFCKYVCPIGQFNFVQSQVSPLEVAVRDPAVCNNCRTHDCLRGNGRDGVSGCELGLFQPKKLGNLDCTFCLDCVHACPAGNVAIAVGLPGRALLRGGDPPRSGLGRLGRRYDLAALILLIVFGGLANAAGMVGPVLRAEEYVRGWLGLETASGVIAAYDILTLVVLPLVLHGSAAALARRLGPIAATRREVAARYSYALVPLGFSIWLAHASFHLFNSAGTIVPAAQRFAEDLGSSLLGAPDWSSACCRPAAEWVLRLEIVVLELGMLLSLYTALRITSDLVPRPASRLGAFLPWAALIALLFAASVWIVYQPMEMRGTLPPSG